MAAKKKVPKKVAKTRSAQLSFSSAAEMRRFLKGEHVDAAGGDRMVTRGSVKNDPQQTEETPTPDPDSKESGIWGSKPSVANQLVLHPATIRTKAPITAQFILSDSEQLARWNALQARMHPPTEPQVKLDVYESEFSQALSSYIILVTYSEIEYQQLL